MKIEIPQLNRRVFVTVNYVCIALVLTLFYTGKTTGWNPMVVSGVLGALLVALATFIFVHLKTHLWKMTHARIDNLDERENQVVHEALRNSYAIFAIICIVTLYVLTLADIKGSGTLGVLLPGSLLYLAHSLPSAILAWREREV